MIKKFIKQYFKEFKPYKTKRWCYEDGILLRASVCLYEATNDKFYEDFVLNYLDKFIDDNGLALGYEIDSYSIDDIEPATVLFFAYNKTKKEKFLKAIEVFYKQILGQPRCNCGNFFHKKRYPYQVWMDGLYMGQPFYVSYSLLNNNNQNIDDVLSQFRNVRKFLFDEQRKLYVHAYDETKSMQWANKIDGKAPNVWSRACGWMLMALVDVIDLIGVNDSRVSFLKEMYIEMIEGLKPFIDKDYNMIYQVVDFRSDDKNYLETSGSAMLSYSLMKAYRLGFVKKDYFELGKEIFNGISKTYLKEDESGHISLGGICQVAGLDNEKRDGSREYYYSEMVVTNEVKGVAPFFMAYSELIKNN